MVTLKYSELMGFSFAQAVQKITSAPTHGSKASQLHKITKQLERARKTVQTQYKSELLEAFAKRNEDGTMFRPEGEPDGFEPAEGKTEEFLKAQTDFGNRTVDLDCPLVTLSLIEDVKVSAQDLAALCGLYAGNSEEAVAVTPGVPDNVAAIR